MVLVTGITFPLTLFAFGWLSLEHMRDSTGIAADYQMSLTRRIAQELDAKLEFSQSALQGLSHNIPPGALRNRALAVNWLNDRISINEAFFDQGILLFNEKAELVASSKDFSVNNLAPDFKKWVNLTIRLEEPIISPPSRIEKPAPGQTHSRMLSLSTVPITAPDGRIIGVLAGVQDMNSEKMLGSVGRMKLGNSGYFFVTSWDHTLLMYPDENLLLRKDICPVPMEYLERAALGFRGAVETVSQKKEPVLSTLIKLQSTGWVLGANRPLREAYRQFYEQKRDVTIFIVLGIILATFFSWLLMRLFVVPLERLAGNIDAIENVRGRPDAIPVSGDSSEITRLTNVFNALLIRLYDDREHMELSNRVFTNVLEGIVITDKNCFILSVNPAFAEISGYSAEEAVGKKSNILRSGRHDDAFYAAMWESIGRTGAWQGEIWNRRKNGEVYPEWLMITAVKDETGLVTHYVGTFTDITARKKAEEEITNLAFYDTLTGLPNRRLLLDQIKRAMASSFRSARHGALLFLDLDNFKTLNDTRGHDIGDMLLQQVAQRLVNCVRQGDTVARLGGDEFVVMMEDLSENALEAANQTETVGEKILVTLNQTYHLSSCVHHCTTSIGVTLFVNHQTSIDDLLKRADLSMYQAKAAGRNTMRFFDLEMQSVITTRSALEADLREAVIKNQFILYYQTQVDNKGHLAGVEALLRWQHPQRGLVSPLEFISLAEETGLILPLGHWVLETACTQLATWATRPEMAHLTVAVNVSARQFHHKDFVDQVLAVLEQTGASPQRLKLELTESLMVDDVEDVITKMTALKAKGVGFSLDDFGTGYSSLSYLKRLPLDQLKIDQGFVRDILTDTNDSAIAKMVIALSESMGLKVIAEGVEIEAQKDFLAHMGCNAYQGYLFSRPLPIEELEEFVKRV